MIGENPDLNQVGSEVKEQVPISLGQYLKHQREREGLTLEQVSRATKVSLRLLRALETDDPKELPSKTYVRGFVQAYCKAIKADVAEAYRLLSIKVPSEAEILKGQAAPFKDLEEQIEMRTTIPLVNKLLLVLGALTFGSVLFYLITSQRSPKPSITDAETVLHASEGSETTRTDSLPAGPGVVLESYGLDTIKLSTWYAEGGSLPVINPQGFTLPATLLEPAIPAKPAVASAPVVAEKKQTTASPNPTPAAVKTAAPVAAVVAQKPTPAPSPAAASSKPAFVFRIRAKKPVWIKYQVDDEPQKSFILKEGRSLSVKPVAVAKLVASEADSLTYEFDQKAWANAPSGTEPVSMVIPVTHQSEKLPIPTDVREKVKRYLDSLSTSPN